MEGVSERAKVLFVDDEPKVLQGLRRNFGRTFDMQLGSSGAEGLEIVKDMGPFDVVVSDLRMPRMDGIQFLVRVRDLHPDTSRILLTGNANLESAIAAVNEGHLFRFLKKPCPREELERAIEAGVEQKRLLENQHVLLEGTLHGSVKMLTQVLGLANPAAFGRASRAKPICGDLADRLGQPVRWVMETAAMLSQIGCVAVDDELAAHLDRPDELSGAQQRQVWRLPELAAGLVRPIPRLEQVAEILRYQAKRFDGEGPPDEEVSGNHIPMGARILKVVLDFDALVGQEMPEETAIETLHARTGWYDPEVLLALAALQGGESDFEVVREVGVGELELGMEFVDDVTAEDGRLLVSRGQEVTEGVRERVRNFAENLGVKQPMRVLIRNEPTDDEAAAADSA